MGLHRRHQRASPRPASSPSACPNDMHAGEVNGEDNYWVRARIEIGDYGLPGSYMLDGDKWVWRDDRPLQAAVVQVGRLQVPRRPAVREARALVQRLPLSRSLGRVEGRVPPVPAVLAPCPTRARRCISAGTASCPTIRSRSTSLLADSRCRAARRRPRRRRVPAGTTTPIATPSGKPSSAWSGNTSTAPTGRRSWSSTAPRTSPQSGFVDFVGPDDHQKTLKFTEDRYWIRARLEMGGYVKPPRIQRILTNTVEAANVVTVRDEIARLAPTARRSRPSRFSHGPAARRRGHRGARARQPGGRGPRSISATMPCAQRRRRRGRRLLGALARGRELLRLGAALAPLRAQPDHRHDPVRRRHQAA